MTTLDYILDKIEMVLIYLFILYMVGCMALCFSIVIQSIFREILS